MGLTEAYSLFSTAMMCKSSVQTSRTPSESTYVPGLAHMIIRNNVVYLSTKRIQLLLNGGETFFYIPHSQLSGTHTTSHTTAFATEFSQ
jgi:hypothetical protein